MLVGASGLCSVVAGTGAAATDAEAMEYVRVRDPVLPPQPQYLPETAEVEMVETSFLLLVHCPGLSSVRQRWHFDRPVHLQFGVEVETVSIPGGVLQTAEVLADSGNPTGHLIVDFSVAGEGTVQLTSGEDHVGGFTMTPEASLAFRQETLLQMTVETVEKTASERSPGDVEQGDASVTVADLVVLFPFMEIGDYGVLETLR
ncbi:hypothetical protein SprV_0501912700 [Sparganum proliferum]